MNIIFLDFDGVIKTLKNYHPYSNLGYYKFNERCMNNLKRILEVTGAKVVVSSNWRSHLGEMRAIFEKNGVDGKYIIDITPYIVGGTRGDEIQEWLDTKGKFFNRKGGKYKIERFIIIDDTDVGRLKSHLIQTYYAEGITKEVSDVAIEYLTVEKPVTRLRYISDEEQEQNKEFWKQRLTQSKNISGTMGAIQLIKVSEDVIKEYHKALDYNSLCYKYKFREETVRMQNGDVSITYKIDI